MPLSPFHELRAASPNARIPLRNRIAEQHAPLVSLTVRRLCEKWRLSFADDGDDLVSEGYIGLLEAIEGFDPDHSAGASFETFAARVIGAHMTAWVRGKRGLVSAHVAKSGVYVSRECDLGASASGEDTEFDSLDVRAGTQFYRFELRDALCGAFQACEKEAKTEDARSLWARSKRALEMKFLEGASNREIAQEIGVSPGYVWEFVTCALERLRPHLKEIYP